MSATLIRLTLLLSLVIASACQQGCNEGEDKSFLQLNITSEPPTLDPTQATDLTSGLVLKMLFDGLTRIGQDGKPEMAIAESVDISADGRVFRFKLREAYWTNGDKIRALDFAYAWRMSLSPQYPSANSNLLYVIHNARAAKEGRVPVNEVGIRTIDDSTLEVELEAPIPYFLELTASHIYFPIHYRNAKHDTVWAAEAGPNYISNGPFRLVKWRHNNELVLVKNERYWDVASVRLEGIHLSMIEDQTTELNLFESGFLDWAGTPLSVGLPSDALVPLREEGRLQSQPMVATYYYQFNIKVAPLHNAKIRKALSYAIDRNAIVTYVTQGGEHAALGLVPASISFKPEGFFKDHDTATAQRLFAEGLAEEGMTVENFPLLTLSYNTAESHHKIAQVVQQQWREVLGVQVQIENDEWKVYLDRLNKHQFDIGRLSWVADVRDPINLLEVFQYDSLSSNHTQWHSDKYSNLLEQAQQTRELDRRRNLLIEAEALLMDEMPIAPIYFLSTSYLKSARLHGVFLSGLGDIDFRWAWLDD
ncbi:MAG: peptide ABC transporter substrate-binding protein [Chlamydiia bacterium]|nr:peptide ABC transporter substrate-binding protein [Chlamydiia bacterium]